jgi:hypothetical protein
MECDFAIALPYKSSTKRVSTSREMSRSTFQAHGGLSTIEDFYQPAVLETIRDYLEKLQDYSNSTHSTTKHSKVCRTDIYGPTIEVVQAHTWGWASRLV